MNLESELPDVDLDYAQALLWEFWNIRADAQFLTSERDQNLIISCEDGKKYLFKITHPEEDPGISNLQTSALLHIAERDPHLPVPRIIPALNGEHEPFTVLPDGRKSMIRLFSFLEGKQQGLNEITGIMAENLGLAGGRLGQALSDMEHSHSDHGLLWNSSRLNNLTGYLNHIADPEKRTLTEKYLELICGEVLPQLASLPVQLIHNDLNLGNILFTENSVSGIVDFGDMIRCQRLIDPANLSSYLALDSDDPFRLSRIAMNKYLSIFPLSDKEQELLPYLLVARNLTTILITNWRASLLPEHAERILRHEFMAYKILQRIESTSVPMTHFFWEERNV